MHIVSSMCVYVLCSDAPFLIPVHACACYVEWRQTEQHCTYRVLCIAFAVAATYSGCCVFFVCDVMHHVHLYAYAQFVHLTHLASCFHTRTHSVV